MLSFSFFNYGLEATDSTPLSIKIKSQLWSLKLTSSFLLPPYGYLTWFYDGHGLFLGCHFQNKYFILAIRKNRKTHSLKEEEHPNRSLEDRFQLNVRRFPHSQEKNQLTKI